MSTHGEKLRVAVVGCGFIGQSHIEAIRRIRQADLVAVADVNEDLMRQASVQNGVPGFESVEALLDGVDVDVVHNCTPHFMHQPINKRIIADGKHILCEKPLAIRSQDAQELLQLLDRNKTIVHCVNFNYRMYPMVQWMKQQVGQGAIGKLLAVHGSYLQDHLLFDTDYNWKVERECTGPSRCVADIGSHWMDLAQTVTGARIAEVCADLATFHPVRQRSGPDGRCESVRITTEDYGAVLFRMDNGARGTFCVSNSSAGRKNHLNIELDGSARSLWWAQENPNDLCEGYKNEPNRLITRDPALIGGDAQAATRLPPGHPEGWGDALMHNIRSFYAFILDGGRIGEHACTFATFEDGLGIIRLVEAVLRSHAEGGWVRV